MLKILVTTQYIAIGFLSIRHILIDLMVFGMVALTHDGFGIARRHVSLSAHGFASLLVSILFTFPVPDNIQCWERSEGSHFFKVTLVPAEGALYKWRSRWHHHSHSSWSGMHRSWEGWWAQKISPIIRKGTISEIYRFLNIVIPISTHKSCARH